MSNRRTNRNQAALFSLFCFSSAPQQSENKREWLLWEKTLRNIQDPDPRSATPQLNTKVDNKSLTRAFGSTWIKMLSRHTTSWWTLCIKKNKKQACVGWKIDSFFHQRRSKRPEEGSCPNQNHVIVQVEFKHEIMPKLDPLRFGLTAIMTSPHFTMLNFTYLTRAFKTTQLH